MLSAKHYVTNVTQGNWICESIDIGILAIGELLVTSEYRTLHFLDSDIFKDGRNKEKRIGILKIN